MVKSVKGEILKVEGLGSGLVAYNPFPLGLDQNGGKIFAARVETSDSDYLNLIDKTDGPYNPRINFFYLEDNTLKLIKSSPVFKGLEDPFGTWITIKQEKKLLFGGVSFSVNDVPFVDTLLFLASDFSSLNPRTPFVVIEGMRDLRFCQLVNGNLIMLTRPTTGPAYPGRIGIVEISQADLNKPKIIKEKAGKAKLLKFSVDDSNTKLGGNALYLKKFQNSKDENLLRLICHTATADPYLDKTGQLVENDFNYGVLHYKGYEAIVDPNNYDRTIELKLVVSSTDFLVTPNEIKGPRFADVVFPGGLMDGYLYCGVGDRSIGRIKM